MNNNISKQGTYIHRTKQSGFTLIEVMVALSILAVIAVAASQASSGYIRTVEGMKTRTLANFVAQNMAAEIEINDKAISSASEQKIQQQGKSWQVNITPKPTAVKEIIAININVAEVSSDGTNTLGAGSNVTIYQRQK